ncbi:MAG TPA: S-adenosylmethionine:tRNA ribosyltransferase-isomerase [Vicinamibacterales bacterium]
MIAADHPVQRPPTAKLLMVDNEGRFAHIPRDQFVDLLRPGDLVVANDAATLPASLHGFHVPSGDPVEVRLAGWPGSAAGDVRHFDAVVFGAGDYHTRTEHRLLPPTLSIGDRLSLGPLSATVVGTLGHPRLVSLEFDGSPDDIWAGLARHGRPIQYAHIEEPLALWDVWTVMAGPPVAFEPPSAGFALSWATIERLHQRGVGFVTITLAAGISSTGDAELDRRLPLAEPYRIPDGTAIAIAAAKVAGRRIVAIGTSVVRALEQAGERDGIIRAGEGVATNRLDRRSHLAVVDAILTGTHEPGTSHHDLLAAFVAPETLARIDEELDRHEYLTHEFGDSLLIERERSLAAERRSLRAPRPIQSF